MLQTHKAVIDAQQMGKLFTGTLPSTTGHGDTSTMQMGLLQSHLQGMSDLHDYHGLRLGLHARLDCPRRTVATPVLLPGSLVLSDCASLYPLLSSSASSPPWLTLTTLSSAHPATLTCTCGTAEVASCLAQVLWHAHCQQLPALVKLPNGMQRIQVPKACSLQTGNSIASLAHCIPVPRRPCHFPATVQLLMAWSTAQTPRRADNKQSGTALMLPQDSQCLSQMELLQAHSALVQASAFAAMFLLFQCLKVCWLPAAAGYLCPTCEQLEWRHDFPAASKLVSVTLRRCKLPKRDGRMLCSSTEMLLTWRYQWRASPASVRQPCPRW